LHKGQDMDENGDGDEPMAVLLHELRQPLNTIILSCTNIQNRACIDEDRIDGNYVISKLDGVISLVRRASDIIDKIDAVQKNIR